MNEKELMTRIMEVIGDDDVILGTNNNFIVHGGYYIIRLNKTYDAIQVYRYTKHHIPIYVTVPLSDPNCFEKIVKAVEEINKGPGRVL